MSTSGTLDVDRSGVPLPFVVRIADDEARTWRSNWTRQRQRCLPGPTAH